MKTILTCLALAIAIASTNSDFAADNPKGGFPAHVVYAQEKPDPVLLAEILKVRAIDNHAHPVKVVVTGEKPDEEFDALPVDAMQPFELPTRIRPDNPHFIPTWHELYGYPYEDMSPSHLKDVMARKQKMGREKGDGYSVWVLDRLGYRDHAC
jgi:hypothetical protein